MVLATCREITANQAKRLCPLQRAEASRDFLLHLGHADIILALIIGERHLWVTHKTQHILFIISQALKQADNSLVFLLNRPLVEAPGALALYKDCDSLLLGAVLDRATGYDLATQARERLFNHLGVGTWKWERHSDGFFYGAYGLWMLPRDMTRLGALAASGGFWQGQRLVPASWWMDCVSAPVDLSEGSYGYQWWIHDQDVFAADGHGGQYIYAVPELDLTLVYTADPESRTIADGALLDEFVAVMEPIIATATP